MAYNEENPALSRQVIEMITVAHEYCVYFEQAEKQRPQDIFSFFQKIGPLLYLKGSLLPAGLEADAQFMERFVTEEQWEGIFKTLRDKFSRQDTYYIHDQNYDSQQASLADNMADIYQDMKDFVILYQKAPMQSKVCAVFELQKLFENHWGIRVLQALSAIHTLVYNPTIDPDFPSEPGDMDW